MPELGIADRMAVTLGDRLDPSLSTLFDAVPEWRVLRAAIRDAATRHGTSERWECALAALPAATPSCIAVGDTVDIGAADDLDTSACARLSTALHELEPWRKGPFRLFGVTIDAEWRSDWKWRRIAPHLTSLVGKRVLDIGCGNGYYGWRMCAAGASLVAGIETNLGHVAQHLALQHYTNDPRNSIVPLRFEAVPATATFDTAFSLGVLYHQRDPQEHLARLRPFLRSGGELVVETLVADPDETLLFADDARYARMRNVFAIPSSRALLEWLRSAGFEGGRIVDVTPTTTDEQRRTEWMRFESLADALDPMDPTRTVEGHRAPLRAVAIARAI